AAGCPLLSTNLFNRRGALAIAPQQRQPADAKSSHASKRLIVTAAKPDRYRSLDGQRIQSGVGNLVPFTLEGDQFLSPELAHDVDLFFRSPPPILKILSERFIFHRVPADADA